MKLRRGARACEGGEPREVREFGSYMLECKACGLGVSWELRGHPYYGFKAACGRPKSTREGHHDGKNV